MRCLKMLKFGRPSQIDLKIRIFIHRSDHRSAPGSSKYNIYSCFPKQEKVTFMIPNKKVIPPKSLFPHLLNRDFLQKKTIPTESSLLFFSGGPKNPFTCGAGGIQRTTFTIHRKCSQWCRAMDARGSVRGLGSVLVEIFQGFGVNTPW